MGESFEDDFVLLSVSGSFKENLRTVLQDIKQSRIHASRHQVVYLDNDSLSVQYFKVTAFDHSDFGDEEHLISDAFNFLLKTQKNISQEDIAKWYGLKEFIIIKPDDNDSSLSDFNNIQNLMSTLTILESELRSGMPIFAKIHQIDCYQGLYFHEENNWKISFENVHLRKVPSNYYNLEAILKIFKSKVSKDIFNLDPCRVCAQFSYKIDELVTEDFYGRDSINSKGCVPFGINEELISVIILRTKWFNLPENALIETEIHSDFDPLLANQWTFQIKWNEMSNTLLCDFLLRIAYDPDFRLDVPISSLSDTFQSSLNQQEINDVLDFLFLEDKTDDLSSTNCDKGLKKVIDDLSVLKSCEKNSLVWKLAIVLLKQDDVLTFGCIWKYFIDELQSRCRLGVPIPGIMNGIPSLKTCILHQKLQQLNYCIEKINDRETANLNYINQNVSDNKMDDSDDEFYDCVSEDHLQDNTDVNRLDDNDRKCSFLNAPIGRLKKIPNLKLLKTNVPMYVPKTQEHMPRTEDEMDEAANFLLTVADSESRMKNVGALLFSDMQSFKAANPGSIFEDFIRWYSPNDWIENENEYGHLSERMQKPDNIWLEFWNSSKSIPAFRQKRLFDDSEQIDKVLNYLKSRTICEITELMVPAILHAALERIWSEAVLLKIDLKHFRHLFEQISLFIRTDRFNRTHFEQILSEIGNLELFILKMELLQNKFAEFNLNYEHVCNGDEIVLETEANTTLKRAISNILHLQENLQRPYEKEFVIRLFANRPYSYSRKHLQFLRAIVSDDQYSLIGAFAEDLL